MSHDDMVPKQIPTPKAMKIPEAKAALDKEWTKLQKLPAWGQVQSDQWSRGDTLSKLEGKKVHFATLIDFCHVKNSELET